MYEEAEVELESNNIESGNGKVKEWFVLDDESVSFIEFGVDEKVNSRIIGV